MQLREWLLSRAGLPEARVDDLMQKLAAEWAPVTEIPPWRPT